MRTLLSGENDNLPKPGQTEYVLERNAYSVT